MKTLVKFLKPPAASLTRQNKSDRDKKRRNLNPRFFVLLLVLTVGGLVYWLGMSSEKDFLIYRDGKPDLAPWRKEKLKKELQEIDEAEQYALKARRPGYFPCYNCFEEKEIYLHQDEIWKYGVTMKGEKGRYKDGLPYKNLVYVIELEGTMNECLKREKKQIYYYALLPENLKRKKPLIRPPGNKRDR